MPWGTLGVNLGCTWGAPATWGAMGCTWGAMECRLDLNCPYSYWRGATTVHNAYSVYTNAYSFLVKRCQYQCHFQDTVGLSHPNGSIPMPATIYLRSFLLVVFVVQFARHTVFVNTKHLSKLFNTAYTALV